MKRDQMQIRVYETVSQMPNGDRDTQRHPCSKFEVVLVNGDKRSTIFKNDQFDGNWVSIIGSREAYLKEAMDKAEEFALTMGACEIVGVNATKHEKEIMDLEHKIKLDQAHLAELKRRYL